LTNGASNDYLKREQETLGGNEGIAQARAQITALATIVLGDATRAEKWLSSPKGRFASKSPLQMLDASDGAKRIEELLLQAYFGNVG
jgi:uncharacterized protein (DUF2384 family)